MKRSTAIRHLVEMAEVASEMLETNRLPSDWPLVEMWVTGEPLDGGAEIEYGSVIISLDIAPEELPWMAQHPLAEWVGDRLRLGKRPTFWCYRPAVWPAWNARDRRVLRFWSAAEGLDEQVTERMRAGSGVEVELPTDDQVREQLTQERVVSYAHFRATTENFWDREWRREHRGQKAEDTLWRAATGLIEIDDALAAVTA